MQKSCPLSGPFQPPKSLQEESGVLSSSADPCSDHIHMTFDLCPGRAPTVPSVSRPHDIIPQHRPALGEGVQRTGGGAAQQPDFIQVFKVSMVTPTFQRSAGFKRPHAAKEKKKKTLGAK